MAQILTLPASAATSAGGSAWDSLMSSSADALQFHCGPGPAHPRLVFPGAFNPLHQGHLSMAQVAKRRVGRRPHFEISVANVDKAAIGRVEALARVAQFAKTESVILTRCATFVEKARLFPNATFVIGIDTALRIADPRYYRSPTACADAITELTELNTGFLVFGRRDEAQRFLTLSTIKLPSSLAQLCTEVSEGEFRIDISSTELREAEGEIE